MSSSRAKGLISAIVKNADETYATFSTICVISFGANAVSNNVSMYCNYDVCNRSATLLKAD